MFKTECYLKLIFESKEDLKIYLNCIKEHKDLNEVKQLIKVKDDRIVLEFHKIFESFTNDNRSKFYKFVYFYDDKIFKKCNIKAIKIEVNYEKLQYSDITCYDSMFEMQPDEIKRKYFPNVNVEFKILK